MQITYDQANKQAIDLDTGMAVEFDSLGPYPQERHMFFILHWKQRSIRLKAGYDFDERRVKEEYPELSRTQLSLKVIEEKTRYIYVYNSVELQSQSNYLSEEEGDVLVRLVHRAAKENLAYTNRYNVYFVANHSLSLAPVWSFKE